MADQAPVLQLILSPEQFALVGAARELLTACETGSQRETGPALLRRVATMVESLGGPVTAMELRAKANIEEAAIAKAHGQEVATNGE